MATGERTDSELVRAYAESADNEAFAELYRRYSRLAYSIAVRVLGNDAEAQDVMIACFMAFSRKAKNLVGNGNLGSWFYWCAFHAARNSRLMRSRRAIHEKEAHDMNTRADKETRNDISDALPEIEEQIALLPSSQRTVMVMQYYEGLTRSQIAQRLGCPEGTVGTWLAKGIAKIRQAMRRRGTELSADEVTAGLSASALLLPVPAAAFTKTIAVLSGAEAAGWISSLAAKTLKVLFIEKIKTGLIVVSSAVVLGGGYAVVSAMSAGTSVDESCGAAVVLYDDNFSSPKLADFWAVVEPASGASISNSWLVLSSKSGWDRTATTFVQSRQVDLEGRPLDVAVTRSQFPPQSSDGVSRSGIILTDQDGTEIAQVWWQSFPYKGARERRIVGRLGTGKDDEYQLGFLPVTLRILVDPSGRIVLARTRAPEIASKFYVSSGNAGRAVKSLSLKLYTDSGPAAQNACGFERVTVRQVERIPEGLRQKAR